VIAAQADRLAQRGLRVRWLQREALEVEADRELLQLGFSNLLGNAIDFAPAGSALDVGVQAQQGQVLLSLRDHGPGVPAAAWAQLGQRFFSTARPGSLIKGSGLGLAIARQVAALHGGALQFEAAEPGLRVVLRLPLAAR
jgi:two-component system, OmpR family, sensor histidine kinase CreC